MEMHQVRYFLAASRTLDFTRAAEDRNVSQPALARAIQQLEQELAGKLLRREGKLSHLELRRQVSLYGGAGRQRSAVAFLRLARAREWSQDIR